MSAKSKSASAQLGTYVTMIVGLLFLFLVVSQAGKFSKDGFVTTQIKERTPLQNDRDRTMLRIGAQPVAQPQSPVGMPALAGQPGTTSIASGRPQNPSSVNGAQPTVANAQPSRQTTGRAGDDMQSLGNAVERALKAARERSGQSAPQASAPANTAAVATPSAQNQPAIATPATPATSQTTAGGAAPENKRQYQVRANETLYSIALKVYGNGNRWREIQKANPDLNPNKLGAGMKLNIPEPDQPSAAYRRWASQSEG